MKRFHSAWMAAGASLCLFLSAGAVFAQSTSDADGEFGAGLEPFAAEGPLLALVSLQKQHLRVFDRTGVVAESRVSTGRKGFDTPEGVFTLIERKVEHNSNLYDDASMPFMQRITWSGVAFHEGQVPNYRASHGCIRLPNGFAERLFRTTRLGTRVVIASHEMTPVPIEHRALPQPGQTSQSPTGEKIAPVPAPLVAPSMRLGADVPGAQQASNETLNPSPEADHAAVIAELRQRRALAEKRLAIATRAVSENRPFVRPKLVTMGRMEKAHRQSLALKRRAEGRAEAAELAVGAALTGVPLEIAMSTHLDALLDLAVEQGNERVALANLAEAMAAAQGVKDKVVALETTRQKALNEVRILARRLSPMTVLISRQQGRVFLRQANTPVIDLPLVVSQPEKALGTHVLWAIDADGLGRSVKWLGMTLTAAEGAASTSTRAGAGERGRRWADQSGKATKLAIEPGVNIRSALDRIELPPEILSRLASTIQAGSTIIVSDLGPSIEMGPGTDIVVQTRGEEQATANIAKFVAKKKSEALADVMSPRIRTEIRREMSAPESPASLYRASRGLSR